MGYFKLEAWKIPAPTPTDYGFRWPVGQRGEQTDQITKELLGFKLNGRKAGFLSRYEHGLKLIQMLWPTEVTLWIDWVDYRSGQTVRIYNNYFLKIFKALCSGRRVALTGCASSGKTYCVAVYCLLMFLCDPQNTTILISTTGTGDAERRIWADIKMLHNALETRYPVGTLIDYLKTITFDPGRELKGKTNVSERDIRCGISLIAIPHGSEGERAMGKVIGTKNQNVLWVKEELPHMEVGDIRAPEDNLEFNPFFQCIGIGNANRKNDAHGVMCEPKDGWNSIEKTMPEEWEAVNETTVLFLHGEASPNFHPAVDPEEQDKSKIPFPKLSNRIAIEKVARNNGNGNAEIGRRTIGYMRFAVGFWYGDGVQQTVLSAEQVREFHADRLANWGPRPRVTLCGADFSFTAEGDKNSLAFGDEGYEGDNRKVLELQSEVVHLYSSVSDREGFRTDIAKQVVKECTDRGVEPENFACDINADGGLMLQAIQREWKSHSCVGLSSLEPSEDKRYSNVVTRYWFQVASAVAANSIRAFNITSGYAKDLFARPFLSVGKGVVQVMPKKDFKKILRRSPDDGDALSYLIEMAVRRGISIYQPIEEDIPNRLDDLVLRRGLKDRDSEEDDYYESHEQACEAEVLAG